MVPKKLTREQKNYQKNICSDIMERFTTEPDSQISSHLMKPWFSSMTRKEVWIDAMEHLVSKKEKEAIRKQKLKAMLFFVLDIII